MMELEGLEKTVTGPAWKKVGVRHHHGINIPLFSIRSERSSGIGEFYDLFLLIDWCHALGFDIIQLLPVNDSDKDASPYNAVSSCALHPIYLSLHALPHLGDLRNELASFLPLNETKRVDYRRVLKKKLAFFDAYIPQAKEEIKKEKAYQDFIKLHESWLIPYALFKALKIHHNKMHWKDWSAEQKDLTRGHLKIFYERYAGEIEFFSILQYLCFDQLQKVKTYAEAKGIFLKGDVPFLVNPDSADVWFNRAFFDFDYVAGSPPNAFNPKGQNWNLPLYNWKAMSQNHYEWWKKRVLTAAGLYHIYRIDHIIGFFRIWAIPPGKRPSKGCYIPSDASIMEAQGRELLNILSNFSDMLPIGEDLGKVPPFVSKYLKEAGIPGTKIFRWQRNWETSGNFIPYSQYEPISMSSVSTHDIDTVKLWWRKNPDEAATYAAFKNWNYEHELTYDRHYEILWDNHHSSSLFHINLLQEYLSLFPELTWENPEDERINYPGTIQHRNWTYRYKLPLETLTSNVNLSEMMKMLIQ